MRRLFLKLLLLVQRFHQSNVGIQIFMLWIFATVSMPDREGSYVGTGFSLQVGQVMFILHRRRRLYGEDDPPAPEPEAGHESEDGSWILLWYGSAAGIWALTLSLPKDWSRIWKGSRALRLWSSQDAANTTAFMNMLRPMTFHRGGWRAFEHRIGAARGLVDAGVVKTIINHPPVITINRWYRLVLTNHKGHIY